MDIISLLATDGYIIVNKRLIRELGLVEATIFGLLCTEYNYWKMQDKLNCGMFYCTIDKLTDYTGLTYHRQQNAIKNLEQKGVLTVIIEGMPATRYFKINEDAVLEILKNSENQVFENFETSFQKNEKQVFENFETNNNIINNNINNNNSSKDEATPRVNDALEQIKKDIGAERKKPTKQQKDFLGSAKKKTKEEPGQNRFQQCVGAIDKYIEGCVQQETLKDLLVQYLKMLLEDRSKPVYLNQWRGLLAKLQNLIQQGQDPVLIVTKSLERGYRSFYPINQKFNPGWDIEDNKQTIINQQNKINASDDISQQITTQKYY